MTENSPETKLKMLLQWCARNVSMKGLFLGSTIAIFAAHSVLSQPARETSPHLGPSVHIKAEVWADNWFAFYLEDKLIREEADTLEDRLVGFGSKLPSTKVVIYPIVNYNNMLISEDSCDSFQKFRHDRSL